MAFEQKDFTGALFKNDKGDNEKRPDYRGTALIAGVEYQIASWIAESKYGKKYMQLKFDVPYDKEKIPVRSEAAQAYANRSSEPFDDSIPFVTHERGWLV